MTPPRKFSALPPADSCEASPKAISRRTSYLRVRLEFLPYPHLIATLFNGCAFGPPLPFTAASTWTWIDHPVSGLPVRTPALLRLGFPSAPDLAVLNLARTGNSPDRSTKSTRLHLNVLPQFVNTGFQVLFHSPPGVLFTFPSQYYALSVTKEYLALEGGPSDFPQGSTCLVVLWILPLPIVFAYGAFTLFGLTSQTVWLTNRFTYAVHNPGMHAYRFGLFRVRSPLLTESMFLSFPRPT